MPTQRHSRLALACLLALLCSGCGPSDDELRNEVRGRLAADPTTSPLNLSVEVKRRVVYLSGKTAAPAEQQTALQVAGSVERVRGVVNDMWLNNKTLADNVKAALAADALVGKVPIDVDAQGDLVRLWSDQTNREERARAMQIASAVEGVREVEDRMK